MPTTFRFRFRFRCFHFLIFHFPVTDSWQQVFSSQACCYLGDGKMGYSVLSEQCSIYTVNRLSQLTSSVLWSICSWHPPSLAYAASCLGGGILCMYCNTYIVKPLLTILLSREVSSTSIHAGASSGVIVVKLWEGSMRY